MMKSRRVESISERADLVENCFHNEDYEKAMSVASSVIDEAPESNEGLRCRFLRARAYEHGLTLDGDIDLESAAVDYRFLTSRANVPSSLGHAGLARVLYFSEPKANAVEIEKHAGIAISDDEHIPSMLVAGGLMKTVLGDNSRAKEYFWMAAKKRDYWGVRNWIDSLLGSRGMMPATIATVISLILIPLLKRRNLPFFD
jgi:hypothetical protein